METKNQIKLTFGGATKSTHPILGTPELVDGGVYVVKNRALVGKIYAVVCPTCKKSLLIKAQSATYYKVSCKDCGTQVYYIGKESASGAPTEKYINQTAVEHHQQQKSEDIHSDKQSPQGTNSVTQKYPPHGKIGESDQITEPYGHPTACLTWGGFFNKKSYDIKRIGEHYIGRNDDEIKSDISIDDEYVSRRSVLIEAIPKGGNDFMYKLTVKSATNPVLVNGQAKEVGESIYLNYGDTILVGNTTLTFKQGKK